MGIRDASATRVRRAVQCRGRSCRRGHRRSSSARLGRSPREAAHRGAVGRKPRAPAEGRADVAAGHARKEAGQALVLPPTQDALTLTATPPMAVQDADATARARAEVDGAVRGTALLTSAPDVVLAAAEPVKGAEVGAAAQEAQLRVEAAAAIGAAAAEASASERAGAEAEEGVDAPETQSRIGAEAAVEAAAALPELVRAGAEAPAWKDGAVPGLRAAGDAVWQPVSTGAGAAPGEADLRRGALPVAAASYAVDASPKPDQADIADLGAESVLEAEIADLGAESVLEADIADLGAKSVLEADIADLGAGSVAASPQADVAAPEPVKAEVSEAVSGTEAVPTADAAAEAAATLVRRVAKADPGTPLSEIADAWAERSDITHEAGNREAAAAQAAAVLLRRLAKVDPGTPLEEVAKAWPGLPGPTVRSRVLRPKHGWSSMPELANSSPQSLPGSPLRRPRVRFNLAACTVHEIVPYGEIYGLHPREFVFDRHFRMVPAHRRCGFVGLADATGTSAEADDCGDEQPDANDCEGAAERAVSLSGCVGEP